MLRAMALPSRREPLRDVECMGLVQEALPVGDLSHMQFNFR